MLTLEIGYIAEVSYLPTPSEMIKRDFHTLQCDIKKGRTVIMLLLFSGASCGWWGCAGLQV